MGDLESGNASSAELPEILDRTAVGVQIGRVRLLRDEAALKASFADFPNDALNGLTAEKLAHAGEDAVAVVVFTDRTVTLEFSDGFTADFPSKSVEEQLTVWAGLKAKRGPGLAALNHLLKCIEDEELIDAFDIVALDPNAPARFVTGQRTRACFCLALQLLVPLAVGVFLVYDIVTADGGSSAGWGRLCNVKSGWSGAGSRPGQKVANKIVGALLLFYLRNYLESRNYELHFKPTFALLRDEGCVLNLMPEPSWCATGLIVNSLTLSVVGFVSIIVVYSTGELLDLVLNSLALFFLAEVDNLLVDKYDYVRAKDAVERALAYYSPPNEEEELLVEAPRSSTLLLRAEDLLTVIKYAVLLSPLYIIICK